LTELRARRAMEALLGFEVPRATAIRAGHPRIVSAVELVPGDVVELIAGQAVPADGRMLSAVEFRTTEAALTGESFPTAKQADATLPRETVLAELTNMIYTGSAVAAGTGRAVVTATGAATEIGRMGALVAGVREGRTPLERRLDVLGRRLVWLAVGVAALVAALEALHGAPLGLVIETGIAVAVAAVPISAMTSPRHARIPGCDPRSSWLHVRADPRRRMLTARGEAPVATRLTRPSSMPPAGCEFCRHNHRQRDTSSVSCRSRAPDG
jgi:Ca2+-transporting ATPase